MGLQHVFAGNQSVAKQQQSSRGARGQRTQGDTHRHRLVQNTKITSEMELASHYNLLTLLILLILLVSLALPAIRQNYTLLDPKAILLIFQSIIDKNINLGKTSN